MRTGWAAAGLFLLTMAHAHTALAHPIAFGVAEWRQEGSMGTLSLRLPPRSLGSNELRAILPDGCERIELSRIPDVSVVVLRWQANCPARAAGEVGFAHLPPELEVRLVDALHQRNHRLHSGAPTVNLEASGGGGYFRLGIEHILTGWDHLLFVLGLLLLTGFTRRLFAVVTAFTVGHSLTLAAATLGWIEADPFVLEVLIAASIVLLARELLRETKGWTHRWPFAVALGFGLVHGLGFAGALGAIGVPEGERLVSLLAFNLGVEAGQLVFVSGIGLVLGFSVSLGSRIRGSQATGSSLAGSQSIGTPTPQSPSPRLEEQRWPSAALRRRLTRGTAYVVGCGGAYALLLRFV